MEIVLGVHFRLRNVRSQWEVVYQYARWWFVLQKKEQFMSKLNCTLLIGILLVGSQCFGAGSTKVGLGLWCQLVRPERASIRRAEFRWD
jgi:hypothetical protein